MIYMNVSERISILLTNLTCTDRLYLNVRWHLQRQEYWLLPYNFEGTFGAKNTGLTNSRALLEQRMSAIPNDGTFGAKNIGLTKFEGIFEAKNIGLTKLRAHSELRISAFS